MGPHPRLNIPSLKVICLVVLKMYDNVHLNIFRFSLNGFAQLIRVGNSLRKNGSESVFIAKFTHFNIALTYLSILNSRPEIYSREVNDCIMINYFDIQ